MIAYRKNAKLQLIEEYQAVTPIIGFNVESKDKWIKLEEDGTLTLRLGYAWDGSSGPTWDTKTCKQASAEHDAFYKLMRWELIPRTLKDKADQRYCDKCIEDGMWKIKARNRLYWLKKRGLPSTLPSRRQKAYYAP